MFELDFGEAGGGRRAFRDYQDLAEHLSAEKRAWATDDDLTTIIDSNADAEPFARNSRLWASLEGDALQMFNNAGYTLQQARYQFQSILTGLFIVSHGSSAGICVRTILKENGLQAGLGALRMVADNPQSQMFASMQKAQIEGALACWAQLNSLDSKSAASTRAKITKTLKDANERAILLHEQFDQQSSRQSELLEQFATEKDDLMKAHVQFRQMANDAHDRDRERFQEEFDKTHQHFTEQLSLRSPVKLWAERAEAHEESFATQRIWTFSVGGVGLIVAFLISWGSLDLAGWLFSDAFVVGKQLIQPGALRPTWLHELMFAAAASLLYLTLFLWLMRILVRMMMSEHHLGVDARSRASMAQTYLALTENGKADEKDRAIVLASLFRPVTDGLIKDDALPLISPASILSGQLAGGK